MEFICTLESGEKRMSNLDQETPLCPIISVVMPVFNGDRYLCEAIDSILSQTFTNFELIIIDDGSTDAKLI